MALLNFRHAVILIYDKRYIEFSVELEQIYVQLFSPYMTRVEFQDLADVAVIRQSKAKVVMKEEGDLVTSLCIIVSGQVEVRRNGKQINVLNENAILEAPDWVRTNLNPEGSRFTVSFATVTNVRYVKFTRELLANVLNNNIEIRYAVLAVLGIKVSDLWLQSIDRKIAQNSYQGIRRMNGIRSEESFLTPRNTRKTCGSEIESLSVAPLPDSGYVHNYDV